MSTRLSTRGWDHEPTVHYHNPIRYQCGCGRPAKYLVYTHREPHCHFCLEMAIDCEDMVPVKAI